MSAQRQRNGHNGSALESAQRAENDGRNGTSMSRAERFEDEKRRIIDSCFMKRDPDGLLAESYITHIRVIEDASSPSSPPPPSSPAENKKARTIIVAVRRSGRVRLHKARENNNGTFSVGKTWVLDHLTGIESFTGLKPTSLEEQQRKEWAGDTGVLVTIQKPYFWQTVTAKEKDFFIGSLVKIYKKYTGGQEPLLTGFSPSELSGYSASTAQRPKTPQAPTARSALALSQSLRPPSSDQLPGQPPNFDGEGTSSTRPPSTDSTSTRGTNGQDRVTTFAGQFPPVPPDGSRNVKSQDSRSRLQPSNVYPRPDTRRPSTPRDDASNRSVAPESSVESLGSRQETQTPPSSLANFDRFKTNGSYSPLSRVETPPVPPPPGPRSPERRPSSSRRIATPPLSLPQQDQLPERKRPPLLAALPTQRSSGKTTPASFATPNELPPPTEAKENSTNGHIGEPSKQSATDFFLTASQRMKNLEKKEPTINDVPSEERSNTKDISTALSTLSSPSEPPLEPQSLEEVTHRPGLGPMIKKKSTKEIASAFRKAAAAHNAFKPRAGGAVDRLRDEIVKTPNTPDGINGVFRAPSKDIVSSEMPTPTPTQSERPNTPEVLTADPTTQAPLPTSFEATPEPEPVREAESVPEKLEVVVPSPEKKVVDPSTTQEERRKKRPSNHSSKYAKAIGIDPSFLEGRTADIESVLMDFGWGESEKSKTSFEDLQKDIKRDLAKVETGNWLGSVEQNDERVAAVGRLLDKTIAECEELDGLLTLYNVELGTLTEDVAFIEAQSQGLQVQTANQRLLHSDLQNLLETISISTSQLKVLRETTMARSDGMQVIETTLSQLYKAISTIDPKARQHGRSSLALDQSSRDASSSIDKIGSEVSTMRAVQEKKGVYRSESTAFIQRFKQYISVKFREAEVQMRESLDRDRLSVNGQSKLNHHRRDQPRSSLWIYSPIMLFAREINPIEWEELLKLYESSVRKSYQDDFRENISAWKRVTKKPLGDDETSLFTSQEKESDSLLGRKLTVKRSMTLREGSRNTSGEKAQDGKISGYESFTGALTDMSQSIFLEQNFVVEMFHLSSLENTEFPDLVASTPPDSRRGCILLDKKLFDPDRSMAKRVETTMDDIFSTWPTELQNLVDWVLAQDPLQGVGLLFALENRMFDLEDSNQEYIIKTLGQIHSQLTTRFDRFVDEQVRGIEDTKVRIKKRKGVIAFIKTFPEFAATVEAMLTPPAANNLEVRNLVNDVYVKINKAMFESLKFIAKESPVVMAGQKAQGQRGGEAEDKEILNYHILLIENMHHYLEEVKPKGNPILDEWKDNARKEMREHMDLYVDAVIRRPIGRLLDFVESTESSIKNATDGPTSIASRASHSRSIVKKLFSDFDTNQTNKGIDQLKKRVNKHFGEADEPGLSQTLIAKVLKECADRYVEVHDRMARIVGEVYEGKLEIEFRREDVPIAFKRL